MYCTLVLSANVARHFMIKDKIVSEPKDYLLLAHVGCEEKDAYIFNFKKCLILERESLDSNM